MRALTHEKFVKKVDKFHKGNIVFLEKFVNTVTKIKVKCLTCSHIWKTNPRCLYRCGCPKCGKKKAAETPKWTKAIHEFPDKLKKVHGNKFKLLSKYVQGNKPIKVECNDCNNIFYALPFNLLRKKNHGNLSTGCDICGRKRKGLKSRISPEEFEERIKEINPDIIFLEKYQTIYHRIKVKCAKCGWRWSPEARTLKGRGCPNCPPKSKAEKRIEKVLKKNKIKFIPQYTFEDLKSSKGSKLRFDFGILKKNGKLSYLIEYDGIQHIKAVKAWGGKYRFKMQQDTDERKTNYCKKNGIRLIRLKQIKPELITINLLR